MNIFVISLENSISRQNHIKKEFSKEGIPFSFFSAITPNEIKDTSKDLGIDISKADLTSGEKACFLSHFSLWKKMINENMEYICIFEDDIYLGECIYDFLLNINMYPKDFDIIKLESFDNPIFVDSIFHEKILNRDIFKLRSRNLGAAGYIISRKCAIEIVRVLKNVEKIEAVDHFLFECLVLNKKINIYHIEPAICKQDFLINESNENFISSLEAEREVRIKEFLSRKKIRIALSKKILRELLRILKSIPKVFERKSKEISSTFE